MKHHKKSKHPVARLKAHWICSRQQVHGQAVASMSHFDTTSLVKQTDLCVGAKVAISGINYVPQLGLYNGARGTLVDIVYDEGQTPNSKQNYHLPKYVVVDFPGLDLKGGKYDCWDKENPTVRIYNIFISLFFHLWALLTFYYSLSMFQYQSK